MSCFWDAIRSSLQANELEFLNLKRSCSPKDLINALKKHNKPCIRVVWNNVRLSRNNVRENFRWINEYNESGTNGHMTSTCDPFLCLLVELFNFEIHHRYLKNTNIYTRIDVKGNRIISFRSNQGHFSLGK